MGASWAPPGRLLGALGGPLGASGASLGRSGTSLGRLLTPLYATWAIFRRLEGVFGGFGRGFGGVLGDILHIF